MIMEAIQYVLPFGIQMSWKSMRKIIHDYRIIVLLRKKYYLFHYRVRKCKLAGTSFHQFLYSPRNVKIYPRSRKVPQFLDIKMARGSWQRRVWVRFPVNDALAIQRNVQYCTPSFQQYRPRHFRNTKSSADTSQYTTVTCETNIGFCFPWQ